ncbi:MAG: hypothetical protein AVDCRST_MAG86-4060 [uncultured Truepera sp.]|uniref:NAD-dependent epimerase/dehydratase domain-containing protein n=1 Tax=uncultured Truepera sp. TaxID=543023 RepID=A0A6J4VVQ7_9DEIN|nr:MAG: hypothetical protein AVDCRST_MAG86-4060 [uncultured Truepera sp.]
MNLLILGGTRFIGRHLTVAALEAGFEVTLFNRNRGGVRFSEVETLVGDRHGDLSALKGRTWDAVIDTSAYTPGAARRTAELLQNAVSYYTFVSTVSVYRDFAQSGMDEDAPVSTVTDEEVADVETTSRSESTGASYGRLYGPLKARCEEAVKEAFPGRALVVRPGLVVGPYDYTDRFTYWVRRVGLAGKGLGTEVLAPGKPERRVQFIDARDLAAWTLKATVAGMTGTFNATGPDYALSFGAFLETSRRALNPEAELMWVDDAFLIERSVEAGDLMPWHPVEAMPGWERFYELDTGKALKSGLTFRPLTETLRDTFAWDQTRQGDEPLKAGLTAEREAALLGAWRAESRV